MPAGDINDPNVQAWLAKQGIPVDADGIPQFVGKPGPPQICDMCNQLSEMPAELAAGNNRYVAHVLVCRDCVCKSYQDRKQFWELLTVVMERKIADGDCESLYDDE